MFLSDKLNKGGGAASYQISRSLRFNSADSAYLTRTPASASNQKTWTWSGWIKRGGLAVTQYTIFVASAGQGIRVNDDAPGNQIRVRVASLSLIFTPVLRDPSAWYHIVVAVDTTQATNTDRVKLYINNQQAALSSGTYPSQNADTGVNAAVAHFLGSQETPTQFYDGNMTEMNFIDGQALTPSSFGETNAQTGVWQPKAYSGSYGTNGFYINFSDNSNTTAATLGKDYSGNGNNWTPNNFSVTAGAGNDSLVDSPTSYGTDTGVGGTVRGNYSTLNPLNLGASATLANGNLDHASTSGSWTTALSTIGMTSGKWYFEATITSNGDHMVGIANQSFTTSTYVGANTNSWSYYSNGQKYTNGSGTSYGASYANGDVIGVALDIDAGTVVFYKNGSSQGTAFSSLTGPLFFGVSGVSTTTRVVNFGQRPFAYTAPSGFKALCTQNLPTPTIGATSTTLANLYFDTSLYTGTNATQSITNAGFQPDLVWPKARSIAYAANIIDSVRGSHKVLIPSSTAAEATSSTANGITAFNSNGFTLGLDTDTTGSVNASGQTFVAWQWKANGGTGVTNTSGSITSTVSANTTSGFSIVTYNGTGANATVGHGLGVAPSMIIIKSRSSAGTNWNSYHVSLGASACIVLNLTIAAASGTSFFNGTAPTSTVFSLGTDGSTNPSGAQQVAYCFAEVAGYSKFGSFVGNASADGPFVYCGFRPAYVMWKCSSSDQGGNAQWGIVDATRNSGNVTSYRLNANSSGAEDNNPWVDLTSNGFKVRETSSAINGSGATYIFAAFASVPLKYSVAR